MTMNVLANIATARRRIAFLAMAIAFLGVNAPVCVCAQTAQEQQDDKQAEKNQKQQEKTQKKQQKHLEKEVQKAQRKRGDAHQVMRYEQAHFKQYQPLAGEHLITIPDEQFHEHFGREHHFHMARPVMVKGFPRFQYRGFSFVLEEPWPEYWYDDDDYYIIEDRGSYRLCNFDDPGVQVRLVVVSSVF